MLGIILDRKIQTLDKQIERGKCRETHRDQLGSVSESSCLNECCLCCSRYPDMHQGGKSFSLPTGTAGTEGESPALLPEEPTFPREGRMPGRCRGPAAGLWQTFCWNPPRLMRSPAWVMGKRHKEKAASKNNSSFFTLSLHRALQ